MTLFKISFKIIGFFITLWAVGFMTYASVALTSTPQSPDVKTDAIIVFTGHPKRVQAGLELWADGLSDTILISGVHNRTTKDGVRATWKGRKPLPKCCLELGRDATDTVGNAIETAQWVKNKSVDTVRLVTSNYHMNRALIELHNTAPDLKIYAHPIRHIERTYKDRYFWDIIFEEYHKTLYRWVAILWGHSKPPHSTPSKTSKTAHTGH